MSDIDIYYVLKYLSVTKHKKRENLWEGKVFSSLFPSPLEPFQYVAWEFSSLDLNEEEEDQEALTALENEDEDTDETEDEEDEEEDVLTNVFYLKSILQIYLNLKSLLCRSFIL